ncbi:amidohydrolase family protein [Paenibacillus sp. MMS20-IR301]|uniref:amidohydrolase family protein n=1 Tax=Paenibacillus sp. MMS20-IR301 TaxID=2895946 RepID=UPI0028E5C1DB|nr:amidohydrolase family protein [Paenibacillus sp. MMS20-IR301]WNS45619.1 amidohydrolase family protein [Paenibacillus sp. MMS20-IR301]
MRKHRRWIVGLAGIVIVLGGLAFFFAGNDSTQEGAAAVQTQAVHSPEAVQSVTAGNEGTGETAKPATPKPDELAALAAKYSGLGLIDAHNHDASGVRYLGMLSTWKTYNVQQVVLFGDVSEPSAVMTDRISWSAYQQRPDLFIPYFSGFDLHDPGSLSVVKENLEKGFFGLGEIAAASTVSPVVSKVAWKANDPMDGYLPQIYDLAAEYKAPLLLHIDPPSGKPVEKLEQALAEHPDTVFIFAHINAYNSPKEIDRLLAAHPNLYADFFAGFTMIKDNPEGFIPVVKKYPDRFMLSTDSGYGLESEKKAVEAMYQFIDLLEDPELARKIAHDNLDALIQAQPVTGTQLDALQKLELETGVKHPAEGLTKVKAGRILAEARKG